MSLLMCFLCSSIPSFLLLVSMMVYFGKEAVIAEFKSIWLDCFTEEVR